MLTITTFNNPQTHLTNNYISKTNLIQLPETIHQTLKKQKITQQKHNEILTLHKKNQKLENINHNNTTKITFYEMIKTYTSITLFFPIYTSTFTTNKKLNLTPSFNN